MKKILNITIAAGLALALAGCSGNNAPEMSNVSDVNTKQVCSVEKNGLESVLATAKKYNKIAVADQVEFMRFGASTSAYIKGVEAAIKSGSKTTHVKQKKKVRKFDTNFATWRACTFAVSSLQLAEKSKQNWRQAVPGDGLKY